MTSLFTLGIILFHILVSALTLQNITCGCINYDSASIRCYYSISNCTTRYIGNSQYSPSLLLHDYVLPRLIKNDFQLQQLILDLESRTNSNIANSVEQGKIQVESFISNMSDIYTQQFNELRDSITALKNLQSFKSNMMKNELSTLSSLQSNQMREIRQKVIGQNWFQEYYREMFIGILVLVVIGLLVWNVLMQKQINTMNTVVRMLYDRENIIKVDKQLSGQRSNTQSPKQEFSLPQESNIFLKTSH